MPRRTAALIAATLLTPAAARADTLALRRVMLSAAGIGYFEYAAQADGAATLGLDIPLAQVDDVLNSLAVFDDHGGVGSIELPGRDDTRRAFAEVPFAQAMLDSPAALLTSLRGEEVAVDGADSMTGRIVSVVSEPLTGKADPGADRPAASHTRVTLLTEDGFRQFILEDADSVRPTDPALRARIDTALDAARQPIAASLRHLTLRSTGEGARTLSVGYVVAAPLWKASYRLILPPPGGSEARVQGWAVLENQSGQDWKGIDLTLHAGNPVTFHQAIYASYYADRPEVPVEVLGRILPGTDAAPALAMSAPPPPPPAPGDFPPPPPQDYIPLPQRDAVGFAKRTTLHAFAAMAPAAFRTQANETPIDTLFHIAAPVDLPAGHTASVPILDQTVKAEQIDWLQPGSTRPVTAIRLTNAAALSLPAGVLTLYTTDPARGPAFAGDARLSGLPAGETRLLGFAEDLRTHVARTDDTSPATTLRVTASHGILRRTVRTRMVQGVVLTAPPNEARRVLVEFIKMPNTAFTLEGEAEAAREETATAWRVTITLKPGETRRLKADLDTTESSEFALLSNGEFQDDVFAGTSSDSGLDPAGLAKWRDLLVLRDALAARQEALRGLVGAQAQATEDEQRVRDNLRVVGAPGALHDKLLTTLDGDETRLAKLRDAAASARAEADAAKAKLAQAAANLEF